MDKELREALLDLKCELQEMVKKYWDRQEEIKMQQKEQREKEELERIKKEDEHWRKIAIYMKDKFIESASKGTTLVDFTAGEEKIPNSEIIITEEDIYKFSRYTDIRITGIVGNRFYLFYGKDTYKK